jgi:hypothetical protein
MKNSSASDRREALSPSEFDFDQPLTYVPVLVEEYGHEDSKFAEVAEETRQELPDCAAKGARLHHQQGQSAV